MSAATNLRSMLADEHLTAEKIAHFLESSRREVAYSQENWLRALNETALIIATGVAPRCGNRDASVHPLILAHIAALWTELWPNGDVPLSAVGESLTTITHWIEQQTDDTVIDFCWRVLRGSGDHRWSNALAPIRWLREWNRLHSDFSFEALELALTLAEDADKMFWWPDVRARMVAWDVDSRVYLSCLQHGSGLVRGWAARAVGVLYLTGLDNLIAVPPLPEMMTGLQSMEGLHAGICGPFLQGSEWGPPGGILDYANQFDFRNWMLETLRTSGVERRLPDLQTLEFYAHELFEDDPDAIRQCLAMGRRELALLAATEPDEPTEIMRDLLNEMVCSCDPTIANTIRTYLSERRSHAGI